MKNDEPQAHDRDLVALLAPDEEPLVRSGAKLLDVDLTVVRTRQEFELKSLAPGAVLIGEHQQRREQALMIRRIRDADDERLIAAIAMDSGAAIDLLEAGADAIILSGDTPKKLAQRIRAAREGHVLLDREETTAVLRRLRRLSRLCVEQGVDVDRCERLTPREREVVDLLALRATNEQIAERLGVTVGTVKNHVHNILDKLEVESRGLAGVYWRVFSEKTGLKR